MQHVPRLRQHYICQLHHRPMLSGTNVWPEFEAHAHPALQCCHMCLLCTVVEVFMLTAWRLQAHAEL